MCHKKIKKGDLVMLSPSKWVETHAPYALNTYGVVLYVTGVNNYTVHIEYSNGKTIGASPSDIESNIKARWYDKLFVMIGNFFEKIGKEYKIKKGVYNI